jgi:hypothetical protein
MTAAQLIARLQQFPPDWRVFWVGDDGQDAITVNQVEPAVVDYSENLVCSIGEPPNAVGDDGEEVGNGCLVLVGP